MAPLPQHPTSKDLHIKTAYISHQKALALGGVHSSRAKTIPPDRLIGRKKRLWERIEFCAFKTYLLGQIGEIPSTASVYESAPRSTDPARGSVHEKDERSSLLWSNILFRLAVSLLFKRSKVSLFFLFHLLLGGELMADSWVDGWVFIDRLKCWNKLFFLCTLYEMLHFAWLRLQYRAKKGDCSTLREGQWKSRWKKRPRASTEH
jgi:hypothetical protein